MKNRVIMLGVMLVAAAAINSASAQDAKAVYDANCKKCHGAEGTPSAAIKKMNPKIEAFDKAFFAKRDDKALEKGIAEGKDKMKPFKDKLKPEEITAVAKYIRTLAK